MIDIYTERKDSKDWIFYNDLYFNLNTGNEDMSQKEIDLIQQVDEAKLTPDKHIETKYGLGTIRNLSSGCKTLLNIVKHPDKVVNVEECGPNVLRIIFTMDNIKIYMSRPTLFDIPDDAKIRFNDSDIVTGGRGYNAWWSNEYERSKRCRDKDRESANSGIRINQIHRKKMAKKKLARFAEMEVLPNVFQPKHEEVFRTDYPLKGKWNEEVFHNDHPIILEIGCGKGEYTVELGKLYPEKNFIGLDIKGARMWKGAKTAVENGMNNVAFLRMYAEMLESVFAPGEIAELWITFPDPQMAKARKRLSGTRFLSLYRKILAPQAVIHLKTDSLFLYRYTSALIELNHLPVEVRTEDLYGCGWEDKILSIKTFYEKQWLSRGKQIKYLRFSLGEDIPLTEPDVEIEKDDYHSETRYMNSHLVHGNKAIRNN